MVNGKVKFFNAEKNFGFITGDDGKDYFFHGSTVEGAAVSEADSVEFTSEVGERGPRATKVKKATAEARSKSTAEA